MTSPDQRRAAEPDELGIDTAVDPEVELAERPAPHAWLVLRQHAHLTPVVAAGGALGALARWGVAEAVPHESGAFAWATLWTNASGAFLLGLLMTLLLTVWAHTRYVRPFLGVGVLGGYTTFSTYLLDTRSMLAAGHQLLALEYVAGTLALGFVAVLLGIGAGRIALSGPVAEKEAAR
jgi:fluoride exporter